MFNLGPTKNAACERLLEELEWVPAEGVEVIAPEDILQRISEDSQRHARVCVNCSEAVELVVESRNALQPLRENAMEAGQWFTTRVMRAIETKEAEIEERQNGVWVSVRNLAPRLIAFCALLLVVGSTWAIQLHRAEQARQMSTQQAEGLFDTGPSGQPSDEGIAIFSSAEARP
jgi:hypothetical protein